jgi:hypothetical protein
MSRAQERSTAIRAERVPTFSNPCGLLAITSTSGTGPRTSPCDGEIWVDPAAFLDLGAARLNELTEIVDVRPVRGENVCCALVPHKAKEGSQWWKVCGGTGSHTHQGQNFCGRHQLHYRTQEKTGKVPVFTTDTVACSSHYGLGIFHCLAKDTALASKDTPTYPGAGEGGGGVAGGLHRNQTKKGQGRARRS